MSPQHVICLVVCFAWKAEEEMAFEVMKNENALSALLYITKGMRIMHSF